MGTLVVCTTHHTTPSSIQPPSPADLEPIIIIIIIIISPDTPCLHVQYQYSTLCHHFPPNPSVHTYTGDRSRLFFTFVRVLPTTAKPFLHLMRKDMSQNKEDVRLGGGHTHVLEACCCALALSIVPCSTQSTAALGGNNTNISFLCV